MNYERRTLTEPIEFRAEGKSLVATGYAAVFNKRSANLGGFVEVVNPVAFNKTVKEADVVALRDHDPGKLLGRVSAGTLRLEVDDQGLRYEIDLPDTNEGRDTAVLLQRGDLAGSSFGFRVIEDSWSETDDGFPLRSLDSVALRDVGPVTFPAYSDTRSALRSLAEARSLDLDVLVEAANKNELRTILDPEEPAADVSEEDTEEDRETPILDHGRRFAHLR
jgi:HK97 family phage prohead protease